MVSSSLLESTSLVASLLHHRRFRGDCARLAFGVLAALLSNTVDRPDNTETALLKSESSPPLLRVVEETQHSSSSFGQLINPGNGGNARGLSEFEHRAGDDR